MTECRQGTSTDWYRYKKISRHHGRL